MQLSAGRGKKRPQRTQCTVREIKSVHAEAQSLSEPSVKIVQPTVQPPGTAWQRRFSAQEWVSSFTCRQSCAGSTMQLVRTRAEGQSLALAAWAPSPSAATSTAQSVRQTKVVSNSSWKWPTAGAARNVWPESQLAGKGGSTQRSCLGAAGRCSPSAGRLRLPGRTHDHLGGQHRGSSHNEVHFVGGARAGGQEGWLLKPEV